MLALFVRHPERGEATIHDSDYHARRLESFAAFRMTGNYILSLFHVFRVFRGS
jgi:hypothetical protein